MSSTLDHAIKKARCLPLQEQEAIGSILLEELEDERKWQNSFAQSQEKLAKLADMARAEIKNGEVLQGDWPLDLPARD